MAFGDVASTVLLVFFAHRLLEIPKAPQAAAAARQVHSSATTRSDADKPDQRVSDPTPDSSDRSNSQQIAAELDFARRIVRITYEPFLGQLGLPPEKFARIKALLMEKALVGDDVTNAVDASGTMFTNEEPRQELMAREHLRIDAQIKAVAGDRVAGEIATIASCQEAYAELQSRCSPRAPPATACRSGPNKSSNWRPR